MSRGLVQAHAVRKTTAWVRASTSREEPDSVVLGQTDVQDAEGGREGSSRLLILLTLLLEGPGQQLRLALVLAASPLKCLMCSRDG